MSSESATTTPTSAEEVRADIEQTRAELGATAQALANKADLKSRAQAKVAEAKQAARTQVAQLKNRSAASGDEARNRRADSGAHAQEGMRALAIIGAASTAVVGGGVVAVWLRRR